MKIYSKTDFVCAIGMLFFAVIGLIHRDVMRTMIALAFFARFLYTSLSKEEQEKNKILSKGFSQTAKKHYPKTAWLRLYFPWILTILFFAINLLLKFVFNIMAPIWSAVLYLILLLVSVCYSIRLKGDLVEEILKQSEENINSD